MCWWFMCGPLTLIKLNVQWLLKGIFSIGPGGIHWTHINDAIPVSLVCHALIHMQEFLMVLKVDV